MKARQGTMHFSLSPVGRSRKGKEHPREDDPVSAPPPPEGERDWVLGKHKIRIRQGKPRGPVPEGKAASMFEVTLITESANHKRYRVSLRSSSKRVPSNPSPNGVGCCPGKAVASHRPQAYKL